MTNHSNLFFYSANTFLSHYINKLFYKGQHYVWCAPVFNPAALDKYHPWYNIPSSSSPHNIYLDYRSATAGGRPIDRHSALVIQNKAGIKRGARIRLEKGDINEHQYQRILYMVDNAPISDYRPLLYIIPATLVSGKLEEVPLEEVANPLGSEFRVPCLLDSEFEAIEFSL